MQAPNSAAGGTGLERKDARTLIWIDAREARIVRWDGNDTSVERIESEVPDHRKATGLVQRHPRHERGLISGGYGHPLRPDEPHRLEHLTRFLEQVSARIPSDGPLHVIGPGIVRERLERIVREADARHHRARPVTCDPAPRLTDRQLVARARALAGVPPRRRTVGAHRWTGEGPVRASGAVTGLPRRVVRKRAPEPDDLEAAGLEELEAEPEPSERG